MWQMKLREVRSCDDRSSAQVRPWGGDTSPNCRCKVMKTLPLTKPTPAVVLHTDLPAGHRCRLHGNAGSPNKSPAVCAQPHPPSTDTPAAANQLVSSERQAWWECVQSVCVFLRVGVERETRPHQVDPVEGTSGAPVDLETQRKKAEETFVSRHLLRETSSFSRWSFRTSSSILMLPGTVWRHQDVFGAPHMIRSHKMFLQEILKEPS